MVWPARSPDLNPIENVLDALGRQVPGRNYPPTNKNTLICALTDEWDKLPQQLLDNVVQSMIIIQSIINMRKVILFVLIHANGDFALRLPQCIISSMPTSYFNGVVPRSNYVGSRHVERLTTGKLPKNSVHS
ncbi:hypothetical protein TNCV_1177271 [Trichonephila clavipes]|nr:hypothetical protein TNCV_1177271 [Trichonephila clavipes]